MDNAPGQEGLESAIRLLELYRAAGQTARAESLARNIEGWLEHGGEELEALRDRFDGVAERAQTAL
jgi:hypothetical protein